MGRSVSLQRHVGLYDIDAVCLSHLHADHCLDLCSYFVARTFHPDGPRPRIPVYGTGAGPHPAWRGHTAWTIPPA